VADLTIEPAHLEEAFLEFYESDEDGSADPTTEPPPSAPPTVPPTLPPPTVPPPIDVGAAE
jgi:hypothetical protein